jgi:ABC-type uncharacterized transport system permease subunit
VLSDASCPEIAVALRHGNFSFPNMDPLFRSFWIVATTMSSMDLTDSLMLVVTLLCGCH